MVDYDEEEDSSFLAKAKSFYYKLEDKYYAVLDSLHEKGIDLYKYFAEPIESKGVPSFPVAIALLLVLVGAVVYGASMLAATNTGTVTIHVTGANGDSTVSLLIDSNVFATKQTANNTVFFENVPLNHPAAIRVNATGFPLYERSISLTGGANSFDVRLGSSAPPLLLDFLVTAVDATTHAPIRDATINYQSMSTGVSGTVVTQPDGTAVLKLDSLDTILLLNIQADNFDPTQRTLNAKDGRLTVQLIPQTASANESEPTRGNVIVRVTDSTGQPVSVNVELFAENSTAPLGADNSESGVVSFPQVARIGTFVYAIVKSPTDGFVVQQTPVREITADEDLEFSVQVVPATAATSQLVSITVKGDDRNPISSANVLLFSTLSNQLIATDKTDENGRTQFTLSTTIALADTYVAVNAEGFLPLISAISAGETSLTLLPLAAGNNVEFDAEVVTADLQPASGAKVELADGSGRFYGVQKLTGPSGTATFTGIPADTLLRLFASLDSSTGQSDVFQVPFAESGNRKVSFALSRSVGAMLLHVQDLIDLTPVSGVLVTAYADSPNGYSVANCTSVSDGTCFLNGVWANRDIYLIAEATGYEAFQSAKYSVAPGQTKQANVPMLSYAFSNQTTVNLISLTDDKGKEIINAPAIEKGRIYTARIVASFANSSSRQGVYLRVGDQATIVSDPIVIKKFSYSPSTLAEPVAMHSTTYSPGSDCSSDLLNNDVNNEGKKWAEVDYNSVSGVVELTARVFVKPTADPTRDKLSLHYRAFAVQNGKFSRAPEDGELKLERRTPSKDECYATTIDKQFTLVEGSNVCNDDGSACATVSFSSPLNPIPVGSPFIATVNQPFSLNFEIRSFGAVEGSSAYVKVSTRGGLVKFTDFIGSGTSSVGEDGKSIRVLFGEAKDLYTGTVDLVGQIPVDNVPFDVEFGDSRGAIITHSRAFAVVQGTGALAITQITPSEFEVGKNKDLKLTVKTSTGLPVTDATIAFEEEQGSPFDGDVPAQIAGDNSPNNGENGQYVIRRIRPITPGLFTVKVSRDRFAPTEASLTSKVSNFFDFDQPDFISMSCNSTTLRVTNTLDVELNADVFVDPACVSITGAGVNQVRANGGADGSTRFRIPNFKPGRTRLLTLAPNSNSSCQVEISSTDPRTGSRSLDDAIQIENTCTVFGSVNATNADGVVYINNNVFQPPRLLVDTFSQMFYGSYQPQNLWDPRYADAASYNSPPAGGYLSAYQRMGVVDPLTGQPRPEFVDPRFQGAVGVPRDALAGMQSPYNNNGQLYGAGGQYGRFGAPDQYGNGAMFDISRQNFQRNWTIAWVNQDQIPHSFVCTDRSGNAVVQVTSLSPGQSVTHLFDKPGLYKCTLENVNQGTIKIKSMCPKKGALYYTGLITRCMARNAVADSGLFDGGKQHAAKIAQAVKTKFTVFGNSVSVAQDSDKTSKVECNNGNGGAECTIKITPLVPRNGFGFAIYDDSGEPNYAIKILPAESQIDPSCFSYEELNKITTSRALLAPVISAISATGLTSGPKFASFAIKFNVDGKCVKLRPKSGAGTAGKVDFEAKVWNPAKETFVNDAYAVFELQSNANLNSRYKIKLNIKPEQLLDGRYLFTTIPTTVGENKLFYRTSDVAKQDPREPGFLVNNLPESVGLLSAVTSGAGGEKYIARVKPNSIGVLDGNEGDTDQSALNSISKFKDGFYLCSETGGCKQTGGTADQLRPFNAKAEDTGTIGATLGDVIGNYKFETAPRNEKDDDKPFVCSGTNYCTPLMESTAVDLAQAKVEAALKEQYQFVETFNLDSTMDNMQDALAGCIQEAMAEMLAQEAQYQMCKTLATFCGGQNYLDPEEEEVEEGESFASGVTLDGVLGQSQTVVKDIICQETEAGQNLQALRTCLQPGNRVCRDRIAARIAGNLKQTKIKSVAKEIPIVSMPTPVINFVTKRIQADPATATASVAEGVTTGGFNIYQFTVDPAKLIGSQGDKTRTEGITIFEVKPAGYDFSRAISAISSGLAVVPFAGLRLPEALYDWVTGETRTNEGNKVNKVSQGFPYVKVAGDRTSLATSVEFDRYQPTLLTLNKYPVMRAIVNTAREKPGTNKFDTNNCPVSTRPVDPLGLFDSCEEIRNDQADFDKKQTNEKAPFSRTLVFQAVPAKGGSDNKPVWPADYSGEDFAAAVPPEYEFRTQGGITNGITSPIISGLPILGRAFYPVGAASTGVEELKIPASDIKRYAVQVIDCKYTRDLSGNIMLDPFTENNCQPNQFAHTALFQESTANTLTITGLTGGTCDAGNACVAVQLEGKELKVAVVDGRYQDFPSSNLKVNDGVVSLTEIARDLLRYYADESYIPTTLKNVFETSANGCALIANPTSALLRCAHAAQDKTPYYFTYEPTSFINFVTKAGTIPFKINGKDVGITYDSTHGSSVGGLVYPPGSNPPSGTLADSVSEANAFILAAPNKGSGQFESMNGILKKGDAFTKIFELSKTGNGLILQKIGQGELQVSAYKYDPAKAGADEHSFTYAPIVNAPFTVDENTLSFQITSHTDQGDVLGTINLKPAYKFAFKFDQSIALQLSKVRDVSLATTRSALINDANMPTSLPLKLRCKTITNQEVVIALNSHFNAPYTFTYGYLVPEQLSSCTLLASNIDYGIVIQLPEVNGVLGTSSADDKTFTFNVAPTNPSQAIGDTAFKVKVINNLDRTTVCDSSSSTALVNVPSETPLEAQYTFGYGFDSNTLEIKQTRVLSTGNLLFESTLTGLQSTINLDAKLENAVPTEQHSVTISGKYAGQVKEVSCDFNVVPNTLPPDGCVLTGEPVFNYDTSTQKFTYTNTLTPTPIGRKFKSGSTIGVTDATGALTTIGAIAPSSINQIFEAQDIPPEAYRYVAVDNSRGRVCNPILNTAVPSCTGKQFQNGLSALTLGSSLLGVVRGDNTGAIVVDSISSGHIAYILYGLDALSSMRKVYCKYTKA